MNKEIRSLTRQICNKATGLLDGRVQGLDVNRSKKEKLEHIDHGWDHEVKECFTLMRALQNEMRKRIMEDSDEDILDALILSLGDARPYPEKAQIKANPTIPLPDHGIGVLRNWSRRNVEVAKEAIAAAAALVKEATPKTKPVAAGK